MLEGALKTDPEPKLTLRIFKFDTQAKAFTGRMWKYRMESTGNALGDLQAINDHELLIIERDGGQGPAAALKKIFKIDLARVDAQGFVAKDEVVDLLNIADPASLSTSVPAPRPNDFGLGDPFLFAFVTIEDVVVLSTRELLVINDNNFPFSTGRNPGLPDSRKLCARAARMVHDYIDQYRPPAADARDSCQEGRAQVESAASSASSTLSIQTKFN